MEFWFLAKGLLKEIIPNNPGLVDKILSDYRKEYVENITEHVEPIKFTVNFIKDYSGSLPIAIASMSSRLAIDKLINHFGIHKKISLIVTREEVVHHKPNPEIYLKTSSELNVAPEECLVFEDSVVGVQAALSANMPCAVVLNGENNKEQFEGLDILTFIKNEQTMKNVLVKNSK